MFTCLFAKFQAGFQVNSMVLLAAPWGVSIFVPPKNGPKLPSGYYFGLWFPTNCVKMSYNLAVKYNIDAQEHNKRSHMNFSHSGGHFPFSKQSNWTDISEVIKKIAFCYSSFNPPSMELFFFLLILACLNPIYALHLSKSKIKRL